MTTSEIGARKTSDYGPALVIATSAALLTLAPVAAANWGCSIICLTCRQVSLHPTRSQVHRWRIHWEYPIVCWESPAILRHSDSHFWAAITLSHAHCSLQNWLRMELPQASTPCAR